MKAEEIAEKWCYTIFGNENKTMWDLLQKDIEDFAAQAISEALEKERKPSKNNTPQEHIDLKYINTSAGKI